MDTGQSILQLAGTTAAIGMGVVFAALFLLSLYMHYFKVFIGRVEARHNRGQQKEKKRAVAAAPRRDPAPAKAAPGVEDPGARVAAAVAVGLRLRGLAGMPGGDVAAAIAAAITMHRARTRAPSRPSQSAAHWQMAGRLEMMGGRVRRQER